MINIENELYTKVATAVRSQYPSVNILSVDARMPSAFPCVSFVEADNYTALNTFDSGGEKYATVMYEVNIYSNKVNNQKSECKSILGIIDNIMINNNFTRITTNPITMENASIYRMVARYTANVSTAEKIYRG